MAIMLCPECGGKVSDAAAACPHCGFPLANRSVAAPTDRIMAEDREFPVKCFREKRAFFDAAVGETQTITLRGRTYYISKSYFPHADAMRIISDLKSRGIRAEYLTDAAAETDCRPQTPVVRCPACGSSQIQAASKGFSAGKAAAGAILLGPIGVIGGAIGSGQTVRVCLACGKRF